MAKLITVLRSLGFTAEQIAEELERVGAGHQGTAVQRADDRTPRKPHNAPQAVRGRHLPRTIEAAPQNKVPGFKAGDRIRLVRVREDLHDMVQLTPQDVLAISNLINQDAEYQPASETERVWRMILATLEIFPGSRLLPS